MHPQKRGIECLNVEIGNFIVEIKPRWKFLRTRFALVPQDHKLHRKKFLEHKKAHKLFDRKNKTVLNDGSKYKQSWWTNFWWSWRFHRSNEKLLMAELVIINLEHHTKYDEQSHQMISTLWYFWLSFIFYYCFISNSVKLVWTYFLNFSSLNF